MLDIFVERILFVMVNFLVLVVILRALLMKPVSEFMEKRRQAIADDIDTARANKEKSEALLAEHQAMLDKGREEARTIIEDAERRGEARRQEIIEAANKEAEAMLARANTEIERSRDKAVEQLRQEVVTLSVLMAQKILGRQVESDDQRQLFQAVVRELDESYAKYSS
ncbi:MAG: F0F1 ATP synthase subunit B [Firmicutes bacterium]|nr:F0F1 ATP synthase subunit B [Bacillota bacterium]